jgi:hypothetical protein
MMKKRKIRRARRAPIKIIIKTVSAIAMPMETILQKRRMKMERKKLMSLIRKEEIELRRESNNKYQQKEKRSLRLIAQLEE